MLNNCKVQPDNQFIGDQMNQSALNMSQAHDGANGQMKS